MPSNERANHDHTGNSSGGTERWTLRLYVAGRTPRSLRAFANLKRVCEATLRGRYEIEVVDLLDQPSLAAADQIVGVPTVVKVMPAPVRRVIGDLAATNRVLAGLGIKRRHAR